MNRKNHFDAIIVGGGVAGASVAYSLSKRKLKILLLERREDLALEASGNPTGLIYPLLTKHKSIEGTFSLKSFRYVTNEIKEIRENSDLLTEPSPSSGVFLIPKNETERERYLGAISANSLNGSELESVRDEFSSRDGFLFKTALAISPRQLTKTFVTQSKDFLEINYFEDYKFTSRENGITISTEKETYHSDFLFLCHANSFLDFSETDWIPIRKVRGQLLWLPISTELNELPFSYLFGDYLTKDIGHGCVLGASFDEFKLDDEIRDSESISFLEQASIVLPRLSTFFANMKTSGLQKLRTRVSFRSQSQDRRPVFGPLPDHAQYMDNLKSLPSPSTKISPIFPILKNTYVLGALGSRGLTHSLFASEIVVRDALKMENLISEADYEDFKPSRFLLRNWKRGNTAVAQRK